MRLHLPKPLHGWRQFVGEVGIIVLGVLIALGAQEVVQDFQARSDERAFEASINHEIGLDLFIYHVRARQSACDEKRAADLRSWLSGVRVTGEGPAIHAFAPRVLTPYRSAWDNRDAQVFNQLPETTRQKYAEFYDELANNWKIIQSEQDQWRNLIPYAETGPISLSDRRTIRPIIVQIANTNATLRANFPASLKIAEIVGAKEIQPDGLSADWLKHVTDCPSVIDQPAEGQKSNS